MKKELSLIAAVHFPSMGIGFNGQLPWKIHEDMALFQKLTTQTAAAEKINAVVMGRKTWESIPKKYRPLKGRKNVVLSRSSTAAADLALPEDVLVCKSLEEALEQLAKEENNVENVFIIGGQSLFKEALESSSCQHIYLTEVYGEQFQQFDTFFPVIPAHKYTLVKRGALIKQEEFFYRFSEFGICCDVLPSTRALSSGSNYATNHEEGQYLALIREILDNGVLRGDRTGTGTLSKFGVQMRFSLRNGVLPLLTTKRVFWRGVAEELLWFIQGSTNAKELSDKGIHIWDGNASRSFLDSRGLVDREEGDLGPVYGFQWRHFGASYKDFRADYKGQGIDQLQQIIDTIRRDPNDRRLLVSAWNPADLTLMALPPCHILFQFYVANGELSCQMYQRSADMGLGVPFNIASYALLTHMVAHVTGLKAGDFVHTIGDAHIYCNHIEALKEQLKREPRPFPTLAIARAVPEIDDFVFSDFEVKGYESYSPIKMQMAV
eukprot:gene2468-2703_t